jgi:hypothetical protein
MRQRLIFEVGGVAQVFVPAPKERMRVIVSPAITQQVEETERVEIGRDPETGEPVFDEVRVARIVEIAPEEWREETDAELFERLVAVARTQGGVPADAVGHEVDVEDLPSGDAAKAFRSAWILDGGRIAIDMERARSIHMDRIRAARTPELARLDVAFMRSVEAGDQAGMAEVSVEKQRLRDLPQSFDLFAASTPEELHALWPAGLPRG